MAIAEALAACSRRELLVLKHDVEQCVVAFCCGPSSTFVNEENEKENEATVFSLGLFSRFEAQAKEVRSFQ